MTSIVRRTAHMKTTDHLAQPVNIYELSNHGNTQHRITQLSWTLKTRTCYSPCRIPNRPSKHYYTHLFTPKAEFENVEQSILNKHLYTHFRSAFQWIPNNPEYSLFTTFY